MVGLSPTPPSREFGQRPASENSSAAGAAPGRDYYESLEGGGRAGTADH